MILGFNIYIKVGAVFVFWLFDGVWFLIAVKR